MDAVFVEDLGVLQGYDWPNLCQFRVQPHTRVAGCSPHEGVGGRLGSQGLSWLLLKALSKGLPSAGMGVGVWVPPEPHIRHIHGYLQSQSLTVYSESLEPSCGWGSVGMLWGIGEARGDCPCSQAEA